MFNIYGNGERGLKSLDLEEYAPMLISLGMRIPGGMVILSGVLSEIIQELGLTEFSSEDEIKKADCPDCILEINNQILDEMEESVPYAVRSSALSERGGIGIYRTTFFVKNGNRKVDLQILWEKEREVYASEFSPDALAWREKMEQSFGMEIFIQKVPGFILEDHFLPATAGVAYTSYQGLITIRIVVGLGTKAVAGKGLLYYEPPDKHGNFHRELWDQTKADAINLKTGEVEEIDTDYGEIHEKINSVTFHRFFEKLTALKEKGNFSLEWAITGDDIDIVQCAPYIDRLSDGNKEVDAEKYFLLADAVEDVLNAGRADCNGVVYVSAWSPDIAEMLESLNKRMKDYLLIVPQTALSTLADMSTVKEMRKAELFSTYQKPIGLKFRHFSNTLAVLEEQWHLSQERREMLHLLGERVVDHARGRGGASHFQQLCARANILFMGAVFDHLRLASLPGETEYFEGIHVWDTKAIVIVDGTGKTGQVYISKEANTIEYSPRWLEDWSMALRLVANQLGEKGQQELAGHFYNIHYAIGNDDSPVGFDPYKPESLILEECGAEGLAASADVVIENIHLVEEEGDEEKFKEYLREFKRRLKQ